MRIFAFGLAFLALVVTIALMAVRDGPDVAHAGPAPVTSPIEDFILEDLTNRRRYDGYVGQQGPHAPYRYVRHTARAVRGVR